jgi:non-ribosomal peptide synthetase component F
VKQLLERVKVQVLGAQQHQDMPFEQVVEQVQPERSLGHSPLLQVMLAWQHTGWAKVELAGLKVERLLLAEHRVAKFDLTLDLREAHGKIIGSMEYAKALWEGKTAERYAGYWHRLVEGMAADEGAVMDSLEVLGEEEREQLLYGWNTTKEYGRAECVHELFEEQVRRTPKAVAVECGSEGLTYQELNRRANRVGHYLRQLGVKPEERVAICVERGVGMVVGLLGILKAGGAYVPVDPAYPKQLQQYILEEAATRFLVTQHAVCSDSSAYGRTVIWLDQELEQTTQITFDDPEPLTKPENLAYVLHCGRRTTFVEHHTIGKRLRSLAAQFDLVESDAMLHRSPTTILYRKHSCPW